MGKKALKDLPLQEITLRKYESPQNLDKRELTKKFLLSIGLLQPGESRDVIVDIFLQLIKARKNKDILDIDKFSKLLKGKQGASPPNIRRQLRRLRALKLIEKLPEGYRITEFGKLEPIINDFIIQFLVNPSINRMREYASNLDELQ
ncbi:hypothetical protein GF374_02510 [Candidatus Woesearchaeota archaeon]|nr:hypothetical protein [Candidatus Woesearchaeota archaeon]